MREHVEARHEGRTPGAVAAGAELGDRVLADALRIAGGEALEHGDAIGEVAVHGTDRGAGAFGDHCGGETLVADLVDDVRCRIQQRGEAGGAARLNRFVADRRRAVGASQDGCVSHGFSSHRPA